VSHIVNMGQREQHTLFIQTFRVVPEVVCTLLSVKEKVANAINIF